MRDEMSVAIVPLLFMSDAELFLSDASRQLICSRSRSTSLPKPDQQKVLVAGAHLGQM